MKSTSSSEAGYRSFAWRSRCDRRRRSRAVHSVSTSKPRRSSKLSSAYWLELRCWSNASAIAIKRRAWSFSIVGFVSISLLVIRGATHVLVRERRSRRRGVLEREPVLLVGENVLDRAQTVGAESLRPITRGLEPISPVDPAEAHQPETRAVALFRMRAALEDAGGEPACCRAGLFRPGDQARRRPF